MYQIPDFALRRSFEACSVGTENFKMFSNCAWIVDMKGTNRYEFLNINRCYENCKIIEFILHGSARVNMFFGVTCA